MPAEQEGGVWRVRMMNSIHTGVALRVTVRTLEPHARGAARMTAGSLVHPTCQSPKESRKEISCT